MKIHAISTGTVKIKTRQRQGVGPVRLVNTLLDQQWTGWLPIYAWVIEHPEGLIVVDTGETAQSTQPGYFPAWHPFYHFGVQMNIQPEDEIGPQMKRLGLSPDDVRWVVMTHLHTDHAGGLHHFPKAEILVSRREYAATEGFVGKMSGYLRHRWPTWFAPRLLDFPAAFEGVFPTLPLTKAGDVVLVSTPGHSPGHVSVIAQEENLACFLAGDTSYTEQYMLDQVVDGVSTDGEAAKTTLRRVMDFTRQKPTVYLPSHDPDSAARLRHRQTVKNLTPLTPSPSDREGEWNIDVSQ
jgi:N-acyl homoserine lactone hydrolase